jgi:phenylpropionate dioxygenase-like ring-hydroxylating dioxygenase large terminal subunit
VTTAEERTVRDGLPASSVPYAITDPVFVPAERYYAPEFAALERHLWLHAWQPACRWDEIPEPGDFTEYRILDQSVIVVRQPDRSIKAFQNACRHRATALGCGTGTFRGEQIVCPFHGWRWNLDGTNSYVYGEAGFRPDLVTRSDVNLREIAVGERYGFVWINFDNSVPFDNYFEGVETVVDPHHLEKMKVQWWHQLEFEANWKTAQEAFFEAYHVMQTHPEIALFLRDDDFNPAALGHYALTNRGHAWALPKAELLAREAQGATDFKRSAMRSGRELYCAALNVMWDGARAGATAQQVEIAKEVSENYSDDEFFPEFYARVFAEAKERNVPIAPMHPSMTNHFTVFPNFTGANLQLGCALMYRSRPHPTDPNKCIYDFWALEMPPESTPVTRPVIGGPDAPEWDDLWFVHQDAGNIERQQTGLRTVGHQGNRLGTEFEAMISNWHLALDRFLEAYAV